MQKRDTPYLERPNVPLLNALEVDISKIASPALSRIVEEVRNEQPSTTRAFDRMHNRHNR